MCIQEEVYDPVRTRTISAVRIEGMWVQNELYIKRKKIEWDKFLLWHQQSNDSRVERHDKLHALDTYRFDGSCVKCT